MNTLWNILAIIGVIAVLAVISMVALGFSIIITIDSWDPYA